MKYIAGPDEPGYRDDRAWAVQRAQELGLDASEIREAILTRARNASTLKERASLPRLKRVGLELKILKDTDLPDVKIPNYPVEE